MTGRLPSTVLRHIRCLVRAEQGTPSDRECLERFAARREEEAFAVLVRRHGPMVRGVCRRVLGCVEDAEDVFQATFLVLARKAGSVRWKRSVAPWLYQVAYRLACKGRVEAARRREHERNGSTEGVAPATDPSWREVCAVLDEELHGLAEKYRAPLVLCYLEGLTRDEAAERLGWSLGTLKRRLHQGRERLRVRLVRRGVTLPTVLLSASLAARETTAALPSLTVHTLAQSAATFASGNAAGTSCSRALPLAETALRVMPASHMKLAALLLGVLSLAAGAGWWTCWVLSPRTPQPQSIAAQPAAPNHGEQGTAKDERPRTDRYDDPLPPGAVARFGTVRLRHAGVVTGVAFAPDGKTIAAAKDDFYQRVAFAADGKMLGAAGSGVRVWDSATGRQLYHGKGDRCFAFAPDGTTLVVRNDDKTIRLYDIPSGRELQRFADLQRFPKFNEQGVWAFALSPDGRTLARATKDHAIECWELASWKRRRRFTGHQEEIIRLVFSADGRTLFSGSRDTTVLMWDRTRADEARKVRLTANDLPALWRDLAGDDAERADRAIWRLAVAPELTVPFLEKHVQPVAAVDPERLAHLMADLDSDQFAVRDQATRQLEALGELAEAELRKLLADKPSLEVRRRAEGLLEKPRGPLTDAERLRSLRVVEVLEHTGTERARRLLARLSGGAPEARLTREAKGALQRLTAAGPPR